MFTHTQIHMISNGPWHNLAIDERTIFYIEREYERMTEIERNGSAINEKCSSASVVASAAAAATTKP